MFSCLFLQALHRVNNNPQYFGPDRRPIVEFAIDDVRKVKLRLKKTEKNREKQLEKNKDLNAPPPKVVAAVKTSVVHVCVVLNLNWSFLQQLEKKKNKVKLTKQQKRELKERALRRAEVKKAKQLRRAKKREQREKNAADDDVELLARIRAEKRNKAGE